MLIFNFSFLMVWFEYMFWPLLHPLIFKKVDLFQQYLMQLLACHGLPLIFVQLNLYFSMSHYLQVWLPDLGKEWMRQAVTY